MHATTNVKELTDEELEKQLQALRTSAPIQVAKPKKMVKEKQLTVDDLQEMLLELKEDSRDICPDCGEGHIWCLLL